jgi:hypothetical protein
MTSETNSRLFWLKYNPTEWQGRCSALSDAEYGLYHRVIDRLWATPGNRLRKDDIMRRLRIQPATERAECFERLLGVELRISPEDIVDSPELHEEFAAAVTRSSVAGKGGRAKAAKVRAATAVIDDEDESPF